MRRSFLLSLLLALSRLCFNTQMKTKGTNILFYTSILNKLFESVIRVFYFSNHFFHGKTNEPTRDFLSHLRFRHLHDRHLLLDFGPFEDAFVAFDEGIPPFAVVDHSLDTSAVP